MLLLGAVMAASGAVVMLAGVVAGLLGLLAGAGAAALLATALAVAWSRLEHHLADEHAR